MATMGVSLIFGVFWGQEKPRSSNNFLRAAGANNDMSGTQKRTKTTQHLEQPKGSTICIFFFSFRKAHQREAH